MFFDRNSSGFPSQLLISCESSCLFGFFLKSKPIYCKRKDWAESGCCVGQCRSGHLEFKNVMKCVLTTHLSGVRGAKQLVVDRTHKMFSWPSSSILELSASRSVYNSSPSSLFSTTTGWNPKHNYDSHLLIHAWNLIVCWLLNIPATCLFISEMAVLRQLYMLPHWIRSCRSNFLSHWHWASQSQHWPYKARRLAG